MASSWKGEEFNKAHPGTHYVFADALKLVNGCPLKIGDCRITGINRGITTQQLLPFWNIRSVLLTPCDKLIEFHNGKPYGIRKWHFAYPVTIPKDAKVLMEKGKLFSNKLSVKEPIPIEDLPCWSDKELVSKAIRHFSPHLYYAKDAEEEDIIEGLKKIPIGISFVENQTMKMWEAVFESKLSSLAPHILSWCRIGSVEPFRLGIVHHLNHMMTVIENGTSGEIAQATQITIERIRKVLANTPQRFRYQLHAELQEPLKLGIGDTRSIGLSETGEEFMERFPEEKEKMYVALIEPSQRLWGLPVKNGLNESPLVLNSSNLSGFVFTDQQTAASMINSFSKSVTNSPFEKNDRHYYYSHFSFVSVPTDAKVMKSSHPECPELFVTDKIILHHIRPMEELYFMLHLPYAIDVCSVYGYFLPFVDEPENRHKVVSCKSCPWIVQTISHATKEHFTTAVHSSESMAGLLLYPDPPEKIKKFMTRKWRTTADPYVPVRIR